MARWIALGLGLVVVGLVVFIVGPDRTAADTQDVQIAALEQRVNRLEQNSLPSIFDLVCTSGQIEGGIGDAGSLGPVVRVRIMWEPKTTPANVNSPLMNRNVGLATLQHCIVTDSTP